MELGQFTLRYGCQLQLIKLTWVLVSRLIQRERLAWREFISDPGPQRLGLISSVMTGTVVVTMT
jgi:hypothetical protein